MFDSVVQAFTRPAGILVYHVILVFFILSMLLSVTSRYTSPREEAVRRLGKGLSALVAIQGTLVLAWLVAVSSLVNALEILPILERALIFLSAAWIAWLWLYSERKTRADSGLIGLHVLTAILLAGSFTVWFVSIPEGVVQFNRTWLARIWELLTALTVLIGTILLVTRRPTGWVYGTIQLMVLLLGILAGQIWNPETSSISFTVRVAMLAVYSLLTALSIRLRAPSQTKLVAVPVPQPHPITQERRRFSTDERTLQSFLSLVGEDTAAQIFSKIARLAAHLVVADICFVVNGVPDEGKIELACGFDLIREERLPGTVLAVSSAPQIAASVSTGNSLRLMENGGSCPDLVALGQAVDLHRTGNLLMIPLLGVDGRPVGGLILLSTYSGKIWNMDDQKFLSHASLPFGYLVQRAGLEHNPPDRKPDLVEEPQINLNKLMAENDRLKSRLEILEQQAALVGQSNQLENDLHQALEMVAHLQNRLAESNSRVYQLERALQHQAPNEPSGPPEAETSPGRI